MERPEPVSPVTRFGIFLLVASLLLVFAMLGLLKHLESIRPAAPPKTAVPRAIAKTPAAPPPAAVAHPVPKPLSPEAALAERLSEALAALRDPANKNRQQTLDALREALRAADPKVAAAVIRQFLAAGQDAPTGFRFKVGTDGELAQAPSLRAFLLDQLGLIGRDAGDLAAAAAESRTILDTFTSPDEWALAMRNVAWADPDGSKGYLASKVRDMLNYTAWQQNPTGGFLEAFDIAAYANDPTLISQLAPLAEGSSRLQQAALVALERMSAMDPAGVASYLNANPQMLADRPMLRADYMGNVDLNDPAQEAQAEAYLNRSDVSEAEKEKFLARLALPAGFVSNTLLTPSNTMTMTLDEHQAMVYKAASSWLASGAFPSLNPSLQTLVTEIKPRS